jgi:YVTN family beta-propeller protein
LRGVSSQTVASGKRSPLYVVLLFAATLGAYWPVRLFGLYAELAKAAPRPTKLTPRAALLLAVVPVVNLVAPAYLAIDLPRAIRRVSARDTEVLSILLLLPAAAGVATAILLGLSLPLVLLVAGYLAWIFNLPAALVLERVVPGAAPSRRRKAAIAFGTAVAVLAVGGVVLAGAGDDESDTAARPAQQTSEVSDIAVTPEALWVTNTVRGTVLKLDKRTRQPLAPPIRVGLEPLDIAAGDGAVWVANYRSGTVLRIDPASNQLTGPIKTGRGPFGIDVGLGAVWVANQVERTVTRIDPRTNKVSGPSATIGRGPRGVSVGEGAVWVANGEGRSVSRVLPSANGSRVRQIRLGRFAHDVAAGGGSVWVTIPEDGVVRRIDPRTARLRGGPIALPGGPSSIEFGLGLVWVAGEAGTVTRLDPRSGKLVEGAVQVGGRISDITVGEGAAWVLRADGRVRRIPVGG